MMNNLDSLVLNLLRENPGLRKREIASRLRISRKVAVNVVDRLVEFGALRSELYKDIANMEIYDKFFLSEG